MKRILYILLIFLLKGTCQTIQSQPFDTLSTPKELWQKFAITLPDMELTIQKDEIVNSDTDPRIKLRRIELKFYSQEIFGRKWGHPCVVFMPADKNDYLKPEKRGKVIIVGQRSWDGLATGPWRDPYLGNYGEPIATLTGYPTMICPVPGEYDSIPGQEISIGFLNDYVKMTNDPINHNFFRLAIPYLRALDVMAKIEGIDESEIQAIIGGHSKRATSAYTAAAMDPERIVGIVYMGNESVFDNMFKFPRKLVSPAYTKNWVKAKVMYIGATNEDGYRMFNINKIQELMGGSWTIEYVPNYRHADMSEKHFLDWRMWIKHIFEGRPLTEISDLSFTKVNKNFQWGNRELGAGTLFRVHIESPNKIIQVKIWYVYNNDEPYWRDLVWYPEFMVKMDNGSYEGYVTGKLPDAWLVEVKDIAFGTPGYISSLPQDITGLKTETKTSKGSRSRQWTEK
jgi:hypothetical protein